MRDIKFRGKSIRTGEWLIGDLLHDNGSIYIFPDGVIYSEKVDSDTIGEYTGLTDKNGNEIYEGDVLRYSLFPELWKVVCRDGTFCLVGDGGSKSLGDIIFMAVVGNIHDYPELAK